MSHRSQEIKIFGRYAVSQIFFAKTVLFTVIYVLFSKKLDVYNTLFYGKISPSSIYNVVICDVVAIFVINVKLRLVYHRADLELTCFKADNKSVSRGKLGIIALIATKAKLLTVILPVLIGNSDLQGSWRYGQLLFGSYYGI